MHRREVSISVSAWPQTLPSASLWPSSCWCYCSERPGLKRGLSFLLCAFWIMRNYFCLGMIPWITTGVPKKHLQWSGLFHFITSRNLSQICVKSDCLSGLHPPVARRTSCWRTGTRRRKTSGLTPVKETVRESRGFHTCGPHPEPSIVLLGCQSHSVSLK